MRGLWTWTIFDKFACERSSVLPGILHICEPGPPGQSCQPGQQQCRTAWLATSDMYEVVGCMYCGMELEMGDCLNLVIQTFSSQNDCLAASRAVLKYWIRCRRPGLLITTQSAHNCVKHNCVPSSNGLDDQTWMVTFLNVKPHGACSPPPDPHKLPGMLCRKRKACL